MRYLRCASCFWMSGFYMCSRRVTKFEVVWRCVKCNHSTLNANNLKGSSLYIFSFECRQHVKNHFVRKRFVTYLHNGHNKTIISIKFSYRCFIKTITYTVFIEPFFLFTILLWNNFEAFRGMVWSNAWKTRMKMSHSDKRIWFVSLEKKCEK